MGDLSGNYVALTNVPVNLTKETVQVVVGKHLQKGKLLGAEQLFGTESDTSKSRWILWLESEEDAEILCDIQQEDVNLEGHIHAVSYQKAIACEVPKAWEETCKTRGNSTRPSPGDRPPIVPRRPKSQLPPVVGPYGMQSGFYGNVPAGAQIPVYPGGSMSGIGPGQPIHADNVYTTASIDYQHSNEQNEPVYNTVQRNEDTRYEHPYGFVGDWQGLSPKMLQYPPPESSGFRMQVPQNPFGMQPRYMPMTSGQNFRHPVTVQSSMAGLPPLNTPNTENLASHGQPSRTAESEEPNNFCTVEVRGPPDVICEGERDTISFYFENMRKSAGGPVEDITIEDGVAYIKFESEEDARRVITKTDHVLKKKKVSVKPHISSKEPKETVKFCTVKVTGPSDVICENERETIEMYFENKKKSAGGTIEDMKIEDGVAYITFESEEDARRVTEKMDHVLKKKPVSVKPDVARKEEVQVETFDDENVEEPPKKITLSNLPSTVHEDFIELFFESKRKLNAGKVVSVELDEEDHSAIVEFQEHESVDIVLQHRPIEMMGVIINVEVYNPKPVRLCTVKVTGPESVICEQEEETLEMYFESGRSLGDKVVHLKIQDGVAFVTFESEEVARRVAEKSDHVIKRKKIEVQLFIPDTVKKNKQGRKLPSKEEVEEQQPPVTIKVKGMKIVKSRDTVELYLENQKRSGGGKIEEIKADEEDEDVIYVTYESIEVAKRVAERDHVVEGVDLKVSLYTRPKPPPSYPNKVLIKGLNVTTTEDGLFNFIEAKSEYTPKPGSMVYHSEEEGVVMITLEEEPDFEILGNMCSKSKLERAHLKMLPVPISNCIWVSNLAQSVTKDTVEYYFENKRKSGGGPVKHVQMNEDDTCFVYFENYEDVDSVLQQRHELINKSLDVKRYLECLGRPEGEVSERKLQLPEPVIIKLGEEDKEKIKFLENSEMNRKEIETRLRDCYIDIMLSSKTEEVTLKCTLTKDVPNCYKLVKNWPKELNEKWQTSLNDIVVHRMNVLQDVFSKVLEKLKSINITTPNAVALFVDRKECSVTAVGKKEQAENLAHTIRDIIQEVMAEAEKEKQKVKEFMTTLRPIETHLFLADRFPNKMNKQYPDLKVHINLGKNEILFDGLLGDVRDAKLKLYEAKSAFVERKADNISVYAADLFQQRETKDYIVQKLKDQNVVGVWEVKGTALIILVSSSATVDVCANIILGSVVETSIGLTTASALVIQTEKWNDQVEDWHSRNAGKSRVEVVNSMSKVIICSTDDILNDLLNKVKKFLKYNTVLERNVACSLDVQRLLEQKHKHEVKDICKGLESFSVQVSFVDNYGGISVRGTEDGLEEAMTKLKSILERVKQKVHTVVKPGLEEHMRSPRGKDSLHTIESTMPCVISVKRDDSDDRAVEETYEIVSTHDVAGSEFKTKARCKAFERKTLYAVVGDMTKLPVDVIVNTTDDKLSLRGGLGKVIAKKGGTDVVQACRDHIETRTKLQVGEVFVCTGGNLTAKYIAHVVAPVWKDGSNNEETILEKIVIKVLNQASKKNATSVALPAISCGGYGFPVKKATKVIVSTVHDFLREEQDTSLKDVYLVDVKEDTVEAFTQALIGVFSERDVQRLEDVFPGSPPVPKPRSYKGSDSSGSIKMGKISVSLKKGEIAKEKVDVIVNTTAKNLDLKNGAVSASILKHAGQGIQTEVSTSYPNGVEIAQVAVSGCHGLKCKNVLHSAISGYDPNKDAECMKILRLLVTNCLKEASKQGHNSIAFPAIGTGNLKYPKDRVASEMIEAVSQFGSANSDSSLHDVRFVVYQRDSETIQAFEDEFEDHAKGEAAGGKARRESRVVDDTYERILSRKEEEDEPIYNEIQDDILSSFALIRVSVKQGDITKQDSDCIVNSSNESLDLSRGAVSQELLKKGGEKMMKEIVDKRGDMKRNNYAWTEAPNLPCKKIIHIVAQDKAKEWKTLVDICLKEAESKKFKSICFPALGTSNTSSKPVEIAEMLRSCLMDFDQTKPQYLKDIRLVIFQPDMVEVFKQVIFESGKGKSGLLSNIYEGVKGWFAGRPSPEKPKARPVHPDKVSFLITSMDENVIYKAIKRLEICLENEIVKKDFSESIIKRLDEVFIMEIKAIAKQCNVQLHVNTQEGNITCSGIAANMMKASDKLHSILRDATALEKQKETAEIMSSVVQWYYIEVTAESGQKLTDYDKGLNYRIENAFKSQEPTFSFTATDGSKYVIDFKKMTEYLATDPNDSVNLIRRDKFQEGNYEPPATWGDYKGNLKVVNLAGTDQEYQDVAQKFQASAGAQRNIQSIQRIQNKTLWQQYHAKKKQLQDQNPQNTKNENFLWHGTAEESVDSINAHGFNRSYCGKNATALGNGVYFAVQSSYSCQDTYSRPDLQGKKRMYYCRVLTGEYAKGNQGMRVPPAKPSGGANALYDSVVDNELGPGIYVIFNDTQAYPEYLITFTK